MATSFTPSGWSALPRCAWCYRPPDPSPHPGTPARPAERRHVTFGSFNALAKLSDETIDLWSEVLRSGARLEAPHQVRRAGRSSTRDGSRPRFAARGIAGDRLDPPRSRSTRSSITCRVPRDRHRARHVSLPRHDDDLRRAVDGRPGGHPRGHVARLTRRREPAERGRPRRARHAFARSVRANRRRPRRRRPGTRQATLDPPRGDAEIPADGRRRVRPRHGGRLPRDVAVPPTPTAAPAR